MCILCSTFIVASCGAGSKNGKQFVVVSGLNEGDEILADGAGLIRPGTKLK